MKCRRPMLTLMALLISVFCIQVHISAANGDLMVDGNLKVGKPPQPNEPAPEPPPVKAEIHGSVVVDGNLGVGTSTPEKKLHVEGDAHINGKISGATYGFGGMYSIGGPATNTACGYGGSSYTDKPNPITGGYSCPAGFNDTIIAHINLCWPVVGSRGYSTHLCWK